MLLVQVRRTAVAGLLLALLGTTWNVTAFDNLAHSQAVTGAANRTPALPEAWKGRWVANPLTDLVALEVHHRAGGVGRGRVYHVKDAAALAAITKEVNIRGVRNGITTGLVPPAVLKARRKDGTAFEAIVLGDSLLGSPEGHVHLTPRFVAALNRRLSEQEKKPIDILQALPDVPDPNPVPVVRPSVAALQAGFTRIEVRYLIGKCLHEAWITHAQTLKTLHEAFKIVRQSPLQGNERPLGRGIQIVCKDGSTFYGHVLSGEELFEVELGRFTLDPGFLRAINREVSERAGRPIDVTGETAPTEQQVKRAAEFQKLLGEVRELHFTARRRPAGLTVTVDQPKEVADLLQKLAVLEVPVRESKAPGREPFVSWTLRDGRQLDVKLLPDVRTAGDGAAPALGDLVEVPGFGQVWIDNQWQYRLQEHVFRKEEERKERVALETTRLVCQDWPLFLKHVLNVVASYRQGDDQLSGVLDPKESQLILAALAKAQLEKLAWTEERWAKELDELFDRKVGSFDLTPGLGYYLMVVPRTDKEFLLVGYGRLTFQDSPLAVLRKAIDAEKADSVELLPAGRGGR